MTNKKKLEEMIKKNLMESTSSLSLEQSEHYALMQLLQYAINKRIGSKVMGIDYTEQVNLLSKLKNTYN